MNVARIRNGVLLVCLGLVLLLNNLDYVSWSVWYKILSLWPVLLVAIGIEIIFKKTALSFLTILSPILIFLAIIGPVYFSHYEVRKPGIIQKMNWVKPVEKNIKKAYLRVDLNAGGLEIRKDSLNLVDAQLEYWRSKPECDYKFAEKDSIALIKIKEKREDWKGWFWGGWRKRDWYLKLSDKIPFDLKVYSNAGFSDLDLADILVDDLLLELNASDCRIKLGKKESIKIQVDANASSLKILIPKDCGLKIESDADLTSKEFRDLSIYKEEEKYWTTNYENSPYKIDLYLDGAVSHLKIESY
jgi:hypothetical protein